MSLTKLPAVLLEDIILMATVQGDLYTVCQLRQVSRFFERLVTKAIATQWFYNFIDAEPRNMAESFRIRLIDAFLGDHDRGSNDLQTVMHRASHYLDANHHKESPEPSQGQAYWLGQIHIALNRCQLSSSFLHPMDLVMCEVPRNRSFPRSGLLLPRNHLQEPSLAQIQASCLMVAVITEKTSLLRQLLAEGVSPSTKCHYLGYPLDMACRLGLEEVAWILLRWGARDYAEARRLPRSLMSAAKGNQPNAVKLLLETHEYLAINVYVVALEAACHGHRQVLEVMLSERRASTIVAFQKAAIWHGWTDVLKYFADNREIRPRAILTESHPLALDALESGNASTTQLLMDIIGGYPPRSVSWRTLYSAAIGGDVALFDRLSQGAQTYRKASRVLISTLSLKAAPVIAAKHGHVDLVKYTLDHEYHLQANRPEMLQVHTFVAALCHAKHNVVDFLVDRFDMDVNMELAQQDSGHKVYPLLLAVDSGSVELVRLLMRLGASADKVAWGNVGFSYRDREDRIKLVQNLYGREFRNPGNVYLVLAHRAHRRHVDIALDAVTR